MSADYSTDLHKVEPAPQEQQSTQTLEGISTTYRGRSVSIGGTVAHNTSVSTSEKPTEAWRDVFAYRPSSTSTTIGDVGTTPIPNAVSSTPKTNPTTLKKISNFFSNFCKGLKGKITSGTASNVPPPPTTTATLIEARIRRESALSNTQSLKPRMTTTSPKDKETVITPESNRTELTPTVKKNLLREEEALTKAQAPVIKAQAVVTKAKTKVDVAEKALIEAKAAVPQNERAITKAEANVFKAKEGVDQAEKIVIKAALATKPINMAALWKTKAGRMEIEVFFKATYSFENITCLDKLDACNTLIKNGSKLEEIMNAYNEIIVSHIWIDGKMQVNMSDFNRMAAFQQLNPEDGVMGVQRGINDLQEHVLKGMREVYTSNPLGSILLNNKYS